jgi:hypothetical protein
VQADLNGDGLLEVIIATHDYKLQVLAVSTTCMHVGSEAKQQQLPQQGQEPAEGQCSNQTQHIHAEQGQQLSVMAITLRNWLQPPVWPGLGFACIGICRGNNCLKIFIIFWYACGNNIP